MTVRRNSGRNDLSSPRFLTTPSHPLSCSQLARLIAATPLTYLHKSEEKVQTHNSTPLGLHHQDPKPLGKP